MSDISARRFQREKYEGEMKEKIIKAAIKVFSQKGFYRTPLRAIAVEAGISKGLIFWYFKSKDELVMEVAIRSLPGDVISECIREKGKKALRCVAEKYIEKYSDRDMRNLMIYSFSLKEIYPRIKDVLTDICEDMIYKMASKVVGKDKPSKKAYVIMRMFLGALMCYSLRSESKFVNSKEYIDILINSVSDMLLID